mgnify:CR=1 FL=1
MLVTKTRYCKDTNNNNISVTATIDGENLAVPMDPANRHYAAILEWVAENNTIGVAYE